MNIDPIDNVLGRLDGVKASGKDSWAARCPCRMDDNVPSLSVSIGEEDKVLMFCHKMGGCDINKICDAIGLSPSDLYRSDGATYDSSPVRERPKQRPSTLIAPRLDAEPDVWKQVEIYNYTDAYGTLLWQKIRQVNQHGRKKFIQRKPDEINPGKWVYSVWVHENGEKIGPAQVLYNLPEVARAVSEGIPVWVVEGEKDANTLIALGYVATTQTGGAGNGKWLNIHNETLAGATIEIVADNDEPGRLYAEYVRDQLKAVGCDVAVWISPSTKDVTDHLDSGLTIDDLLQYEDSDGVIADMIPSYDTPVLLEPAPVLVEPVVSETTRVLGEIFTLLTDENLDETQKLLKTSRILSGAFHDKPVDTGRLVNWQEFLEEADVDSYDWVIPGVLERGERAIIVAAEGVGKTMLARQVAILCAAGIQPFTFQKMNPVRTLTIDLENPEKIIRRTSRSIMKEALRAGFVKSPQVYLHTKPSGLNLINQQDRKILEDQIEKIKPDLLCLGPLYKSFVDPGGRTAEAIATEVAKYLDTIREIYKCAMWIEHHAPLGTSMTSRDLRPFGSAVWSRWPEFGISLQPDPTANTAYVYDVRHFRGARDERHWPTKMKRGTRFPFEVLEFSKVGT